MSATATLQDRVLLEANYLLSSLATGDALLIASDAQALRARLTSLDSHHSFLRFSASSQSHTSLWSIRALLRAVQEQDALQVALLSATLRSEFGLLP